MLSLRTGIPWHWEQGGNGVLGDLRDEVVSGCSIASQVWVRAVGINASSSTVFNWVTQLRRAPYSYDCIDNFGRRSPVVLDVGLASINVGDAVMTIFRVVNVTRGEEVRICLNSGTPQTLFGPITVTYTIVPAGLSVYLVARLDVGQAKGLLPRFRRWILAWGDFIMMRRQLLVLKRRSESASR